MHKGCEFTVSFFSHIVTFFLALSVTNRRGQLPPSHLAEIETETCGRDLEAPYFGVDFCFQRTKIMSMIVNMAEL